MAEKIDILLQIRSELSGLKKAQEESSKLSNILKTGFGVGVGLGTTQLLSSLTQNITKGVSAGLKFNATVEQQTVAFQTLLGTVGEADKRIKELVDFAASTPFELPELIEANKVLQVMSDGVLATSEGMRILGDAAAAVGRPINEVSTWFGRLYAGLQSGTPVGEATLRLLEMGLISGDTAKELQNLAKEGRSGSEAFSIIEETFRDSAGAMQLQARTFNGLSSTLRDTLRSLAGELTKGLFDDLKEDMEDVLILLGALPSKTQEAVSGIKGTLAELSDAAKKASVSTADAVLSQIDSEIATAEKQVKDLEKRLAETEAQARQLLPQNPTSSAAFGINVGKFKELSENNEFDASVIEERKKELEELIALRQRLTSEEGKQAQEVQEVINQELAKENAFRKENDKLVAEAAKNNEQLAEAVAKLNEQKLKASQTDQERQRYIAQELQSLATIQAAEENRANLLESTTDRASVLENIRLKFEQKRIPLLIEQQQLTSKLARTQLEVQADAVKLQASQLEHQIDQIEHQKELIQLTGDTATNRKKITGLVEDEKKVLQELIDLWFDYSLTVKDPALLDSIIRTTEALERRKDKAGGPPRLTPLQQSEEGFASLTDPYEHFQDNLSAAQAALLDYQTQIGTVSDQIYDSIISIQDALSGGISDSIGDLIRGTEDWSGALENVGLTVGNSVIASFSDMLAQWIVTQLKMIALGKVFSAQRQAINVTEATTSAATWTPAAIMASIGSFGVAAGVGIAAVLAAKALGGFAEGGYTGPGGKYDVAGSVHAGEFVMPADVVRKTGPGYFYEQMKDIRTGGGKGGSGGGMNMAVFDSRKSAQRWAESQEFETRVVELMELNKGRFI